MPAMDFCNTMEFPIARLWIFNLQLSVFLSYNKHLRVCANGNSYVNISLYIKLYLQQQTLIREKDLQGLLI